MDFQLDQDLTALQSLAHDVFAKPARQSDLGPRPDPEVWRDLAAADLLSAPLPGSVGGSELGLAGLTVLLGEQGVAMARVPLWPALLAALCLEAHPETAEVRDVPRTPDAEGWTTLALEETGNPDPTAPKTIANPFSGGWELTGLKSAVPGGTGSRSVLVSATTDSGPALFHLRSDAPGLQWEPGTTSSHSEAAELRLLRVPAQRVVGTDPLGWLLPRVRVALTALQVGVCRGALTMAADYLSQRHQFGRPLGGFQAVQHQLADSWIWLEAMQVCLWKSVSELDAGEYSGADHVAKWWADQGGMDVLHAVQHVHGGIGVDVDYPVHRAFLMGKEIATTLGGSGQELELLGDLVVAGKESA